MSKDKTTTHPIPVIDRVYHRSFVGIWKRMFVSGRPEGQFVPLIFNGERNNSCYGPIGPGSRIGRGYVQEVNPMPGNPDKGEIKIKFRYQTIIWNYTLNRNNGFKSEFNPLPGSNQNAPVLNELLLVGQGVRQLYAFFSHSWKPAIDIRELNRLVNC